MNKCWNEWPIDDKTWINHKNELPEIIQDEVEYRMFLQYILFEQWMNLRKYANILVDKNNSISEIPYLDEIINQNDDYIKRQFIIVIF